MTALRPASVLLIIGLLTAGCGGGDAGETPATVAPAATWNTSADPHPCDLLTDSQAAEVLGAPIEEVVRSGPGGPDGEQASCTWVSADDIDTLGVIVEGPAFFSTSPAGYTTSVEAYDFWRDDTLGAGFPLESIDAVGDDAFIPRIGSGPANTMVMCRGEYLVHITLLAPGSGIAERMIDAARMLAAAHAGSSSSLSIADPTIAPNTQTLVIHPRKRREAPIPAVAIASNSSFRAPPAIDSTARRAASPIRRGRSRMSTEPTAAPRCSLPAMSRVMVTMAPASSSAWAMSVIGNKGL